MQALRDKTLQTEDLETAQEYLERLKVTHPWTAPDGRVTDRSGTWSNGDKTLAITQFEWKAQFAPENDFELVIEKANRHPHRLDLLFINIMIYIQMLNSLVISTVIEVYF